MGPPPQRVLFVSNTLGGGGAERFVATVLRLLDRERFRPELCLVRDERAYPLPDDVPVHVLQPSQPAGRSGPAGLLLAVWHLARRIDALRPDWVVSAFAGPSFLTGNALPLAAHRPAWLARVSSDPDLTERGPLRAWMRRLYRRAERVVANSERLCERVAAVHAPPRGVDWLPNATDFEAVDRLAREPAPAAPPGRLRVVSMGRLEKVKRFDLLLEAVARLRPRTDLELVVLGEGRERAALEALAREVGLADRLHLPGFLPNPYPWLARSDLFALSSDTEGLPNALVEAQGLGLAAVATDCPTGPAEVVEDGVTGRLVPTGDAGALADALAELLGDAERRRACGVRGRERAWARYSAPIVTHRLESLLERDGTPRRKSDRDG